MRRIFAAPIAFEKRRRFSSTRSRLSQSQKPRFRIFSGGPPVPCGRASKLAPPGRVLKPWTSQRRAESNGDSRTVSEPARRNFHGRFRAAAGEAIDLVFARVLGRCESFSDG